MWPPSPSAQTIMALPSETGILYSVLLEFSQQGKQYEIIYPSRGAEKFTAGNFMLVFRKKEINQMIKKRKRTMELERFLSHHSAQLSHLTEEGMESREIDLGDQTRYSKNSCGFVPGRVANKIWLVPKSPDRVTALCLSTALQVYLEARTRATLHVWMVGSVPTWSDRGLLAHLAELRLAVPRGLLWWGEPEQCGCYYPNHRLSTSAR